MKHFVFFIVLIPLLATGCATLEPVKFSSTPTDQASQSDPCLDPEELLYCTTLTLDASMVQDRPLVGQRLLSASLQSGMSSGDVERAARIALWLNRTPWLPLSIKSSLPEQLTEAQVPAEPIPPGAVIVFEGGVLPSGALAEQPVVQVPLKIPLGDGPLQGDSLVNIAVAAVGGVAGVYDGDRVVQVARVP